MDRDCSELVAKISHLRQFDIGGVVCSCEGQDIPRFAKQERIYRLSAGLRTDREICEWQTPFWTGLWTLIRTTRSVRAGFPAYDCPLGHYSLMVLFCFDALFIYICTFMSDGYLFLHALVTGDRLLRAKRRTKCDCVHVADSESWVGIGGQSTLPPVADSIVFRSSRISDLGSKSILSPSRQHREIENGGL